MLRSLCLSLTNHYAFNSYRLTVSMFIEDITCPILTHLSLLVNYFELFFAINLFYNVLDTDIILRAPAYAFTANLFSTQFITQKS